MKNLICGDYEADYQKYGLEGKLHDDLMIFDSCKIAFEKSDTSLLDEELQELPLKEILDNLRELKSACAEVGINYIIDDTSDLIHKTLTMHKNVETETFINKPVIMLLGKNNLAMNINTEIKGYKTYAKKYNVASDVVTSFLDEDMPALNNLELDYTVKEFDELVTALVANQDKYNIKIDTTEYMKIFPTTKRNGLTSITKAVLPLSLEEALALKLKTAHVIRKETKPTDTEPISKKEKWDFDDIAGEFGQKILTKEDLETLIECIKSTLTYITNGGKPSYISISYLKQPINVKKRLDLYNEILDVKTLSPGEMVTYFRNMSIKLPGDKEWTNLFYWIEITRKTISKKRAIFRPVLRPDPDIFNFFQGFVHQYKDGPELPTDENYFKPDMERVNIILDHIRIVWCRDNEEHYNYIINWLAFRLQYPHVKLPIMIVIYSEEGIGKSVILESLVKYVFGTKYGLMISDPNHIVGNFTGLAACKLLVVFDDIKRMTEEAKTAIKTLITSENTVIREMYTNPKEDTNYASYFMLTNKKSDLFHSRRGFMVEGDNDYATKGIKYKDYFKDGKYERLKDPETYKHLAHYLAQKDIEAWDATKDKPETDLMKQLQNIEAPHILKFLDKLVSGSLEKKKFFDKDNDYGNYTPMEAGETRNYPSSELLIKFNTYLGPIGKNYTDKQLKEDILKTYKIGTTSKSGRFTFTKPSDETDKVQLHGCTLSYDLIKQKIGDVEDLTTPTPSQQDLISDEPEKPLQDTKDSKDTKKTIKKKSKQPIKESKQSESDEDTEQSETEISKLREKSLETQKRLKQKNKDDVKRKALLDGMASTRKILE